MWQVRQGKRTTAEEYISILRFRAAYNDCRDAYGGVRDLAFKGVLGCELVAIFRQSREFDGDHKDELLLRRVKK
jgi:hypothetical protein